MKMLKEVDQHRLVISDMEVADEDIPSLTRFLAHRQTLNLIEVIEINRTSGISTSQRRCARDFSALNSNKGYLLKKLLDFISQAVNVRSISFENVHIPIELLPLLGKTISTTKSGELWSKCSSMFRYTVSLDVICMGTHCRDMLCWTTVWPIV